MWLNVRAHPRSNLALVAAFVVMLFAGAIPWARSFSPLLTRLLAGIALVIFTRRTGAPSAGVRPLTGNEAILPGFVSVVVVVAIVVTIFSVTGQFD
jgi:Fe2+ transport system protein B